MRVAAVVCAIASGLAAACPNDGPPPTNTLTISGAGAGSGTVTSSPAGINCSLTSGGAPGGGCSMQFPVGSVTLTAAAATGSTFTGWTGDCSGSSTCVVDMSRARSITATFGLASFPLTVTGGGTGSGTVTSSGATPAVSCSITLGAAATSGCSGSYLFNTSVTLNAAVTTGSTFAGWSGACTGTGPCVVSMNQVRSVTATFTLQSYTVRVLAGGAGHGTVKSQVGLTPAIDCTVTGGVPGGACSQSYTFGTTVTLTPTPNPVSGFSGWSGGGCTGTGTCIVSVTQETSVTATFSLQLHGLTITGAGAGTGSVLTTGGVTPAIDCDVTAGTATGACSANYAAGSTITLGVITNPGSTFTGWSGDCGGTGTCAPVMTQARSVTATFAIQFFTLTLSGSGSGTIATSGANPAIACTITDGAPVGTCQASYPFGTDVQLVASPAPGKSFGGWGGACTGTGGCTVSITQDRSVTAAFPTVLLPVTVIGSGSGSGTVTSQAGLAPPIDCTVTGGVAAGACDDDYPSGEVVTLTATPASGSDFAGWSGDCTGTGTCTLTVTQVRTVTATFSVRSFSLTVSATGAGNGSVTTTGGVNPAISCTSTAGTAVGDCMRSYTYGTVVTLQATPASGSLFAGWSGACTGTGTCIVTVDQARSVTAGFEIQSFTLTVSGTGSGTIASSSPSSAISCTISNGTASGTCQATYPTGTTVDLVATPANGNGFSGWGGACSGSGSCTVAMTQDRSVTGAFATSVLPLTVIGAGTGSGTVGSQVGLNPTIACTVTGGVTSGTCANDYNYGQVVTLTPAPASGSAFAGWSGHCSGTGTCSVTLDQGRTVTATFALQSFDLAVTAGGSGSGTVATTGGITPAVSCSATAGSISGDCIRPYAYGTIVTLQATPSSGSLFTGWGGDCTGTGSCSVTLDQARAVTATFAIQMFTLTISGSGSGTIATTGADPAVSCTLTAGVTSGTCQASYPSGTGVTLEATPGASQTFSGWGGACSGTGSCAVAMSQDRSVTAAFATSTLHLTVIGAGSGNGSVTSQVGLSPSISCTVTAGVATGTCENDYLSGEVVTLTAAPGTGSDFTGWSGDCTGIGTCTVTVTQVRTVTATFTLQTFALAVTAGGDGNGTIATTGGIDPAIACNATAGAATGDCVRSYDYGAVVNLQATPSSGSFFTGWSGDCTGTGACSVTMDQARAASATFAIQTFTLTLTGTGSGTIATNGASPALSCTITDGIASGTCSAAYPGGTDVSLEATPAAGRNFGGWGGACTGTGACITAMTQDRSITASFPVSVYHFTLIAAGSGSGNVASQLDLDPAVACTVTSGVATGTCENDYDSGTTVTLTATPSAGSDFTGWSGDCTGTGTCNVTVTQARTVNATFTLQTFALTVTAGGGGNGTIATTGGIDPAIACTATAGATTGDCVRAYDYSTVVTLQATPASGSLFTGWSGDCTGAGACSVTTDQARAVTATFAIQTFTLTLSGTGTGTIATNGASPALSCTLTSGVASGACQAAYPTGTDVDLEATAAVGTTFSGWGGACTGSGPCTVAMTQDRVVTAAFPITVVQLTVIGAGSGSGAVTSQPGLDPAVACTVTSGVAGGTCVNGYDYGQVVTLTATPTTGSDFTGWSGPCTGTGSCDVTMDQARSVTATFTLQNFTLTVTGAGVGNGIVNSTGGLDPAIACSWLAASNTGDCNQSYSYGTVVNLQATSAAGSTFTGWSGDCTAGSCSVTMDQPRAVTASFAIQTFTLTVTGSGSTGTGTVTTAAGITPAISCVITAGIAAGTCSVVYNTGTSVSLEQTTGVGSTFDGWSGTCTGTGACSTDLTQDRTVSAGFTIQTFTLTVVGGSTGDGLVTSQVGLSPAISCTVTGGTASGDCNQPYDYGTAVTLTAAPSDPSFFAGWGGDCSGTGSCAIEVTATRSVTASFTAPAPTALAAWGETNYSTQAGTPVSSAPAVIVRDQLGRPFPTVVRFQVASGTSTLSPASPADVAAGPNGVAALTSWTPGGSGGATTVQASVPSVPGLTPVVFDASGVSNGAITTAMIRTPADTIYLKARPSNSIVVDGSDLAIFNTVPSTLNLSVVGEITRHAVNPPFWEEGDPVSRDTICVTFLPGSCAAPSLVSTATNTVPAMLRIISGGASWGGDHVKGRFTVSSTTPGVDPLVIPFRLNFDANPMFAAEPRGLVFRMIEGGALPPTQTDSLIDENVGSGNDPIALVSVGPITYGLGTSNWLTTGIMDTVQLDDGFGNIVDTFFTPNRLAVNVVTAPPVGTYTASVPVVGYVYSNETATLRVTLIVDPRPTISLSASAAAFTLNSGAPSPGPLVLNVTNSGAGSLTGLSVSSSQAWATPSLGGVTAAPATLTITLDTTGLAPGNHSATVTVSSTLPGTTSRTYIISITVLP